MYRYKIDKNNRLILEKKKNRISPQGEFKIDQENNLVFWLNEPVSWRKKYNLPENITYTGKWSLDKEHNLVLDIIEDKNYPQKEPLVLKGEILSTDKDELAFMIKSYEQKQIQRVQILKLTGKWFSDEYNRLNFLVEKKGSPDILIFKNSWSINPQQKITYAYQKTNLKTKTKSLHSFELEGFWQIDNQNQLSYILEKGEKSKFNFFVQLESPNLYPQEGVIKYRIGIGLKQEKTQIICLYGKWQLSKEGKVFFLMEYDKEKIKKIEFGLGKRISQGKEIEFILTNTKEQPIGFSITFTQNFLKDSNLTTFLKLGYSQKEKKVETGVKFSF